MKKYEWRKKEKAHYLPKNVPAFIDVPAFKFVTIEGEGSPENESFLQRITALYSISYAIKMNLKKMPDRFKGYVDYTVYPLEGVWDINEAARKRFTGVVNKNDFVFKIMIRQPDFVTDDFYEEMLEQTKKKKPLPLLDNLKFESIKEGPCVQMLHIGSYDNEPESFAIMEAFAKQENLSRLSKVHREIYLSDFRKVAKEKLKTVLRFKVES